MDVAGTMTRVRKDFESKSVNPNFLRVLYTAYNNVPDPDHFVRQAIEQFPVLACGVATVYLQHELKAGRIVKGTYLGNDHTFLLLDEDRIVDITADQYGGDPTYFGVLKEPWALK